MEEVGVVFLGIVALAIIITLISMAAIALLLLSPLAFIAWLFYRRNPFEPDVKLVLFYGTMGLSTVIYFLVNPWVGLTGVVVFGGGTALWYLNHPWFEAKRQYDAKRVEYRNALKCPPDRFRKVAEAFFFKSDTGYELSKEPFIQYMVRLADEIYRENYREIPFPEFPPFDLGYNRMMLSMVAEDMETALTWISGEVTRANLTINLVQYILEIPYEDFYGLGFEGAFHAPLYEFIPDIGAMVHQMVAIPFEDKYTSAEVGSSIRTTLRENITAASGGEDRDWVMPGKFDGMPLEVVTAYLKGTGFEEVFTGLAPALVFNETLRASHGVIIAGTDGGKSQTLENLILADLDQDDPPGMVVIDSKAGPRDLLQRIARLDIFHPDHGRLRDRLVIIDPRERPALNLFDVDVADLDDQAVNDVVSSLQYFLGSLLGSDITGKQSVIFIPLVELMCHVPRATLNDFIKVLDDLTPYLKYVQQLQPETRDFLLSKEYSGSHYRETKVELTRRLRQITLRRTLSRMFSAPQNSLNLARALNEGKIILVSAERAFLSSELSPMFARYFISRVISAALDRGRMVEGSVKPARIYIDECAPYVDEKLDEMLTTLRSYGLGAMLAFQNVHQMGNYVHTIQSNTAIKLMSTVSASDARAFAGDMRTSAEFIMENEKPSGSRPPFGKFACYARGMPRAISIQVPFGALDQRLLMSDHDYHRMRMFNRHKHMADPVPSEPQDDFDGTTIDGEADEIPANQRGLPGPQRRKPPAQKPPDDPTATADDYA